IEIFSLSLHDALPIWDIPLVEGYEYEFLENISKDPGSHHFNGIDNPDILERIDSFSPDAILVYGWSFKSHLKCIRHYHDRKPVQIGRAPSELQSRFDL